MQKRHGTWQNRSSATRQTATLYEIKILSQFLYKSRDLQEIVTVIGVAHQHKLALAGFDAVHQRRTVPANGHVDGSRSVVHGDLFRCIRAAIVRQNDFAIDASFAHRADRFFDADTHCIRLVQTGHYNR